MLGSVDRQREQPQQTSQIVSSIPATYHVPRGPAAVANISAPRSTVATPIVRASIGQPVPISRTGYKLALTNPSPDNSKTKKRTQESHSSINDIQFSLQSEHSCLRYPMAAESYICSLRSTAATHSSRS